MQESNEKLILLNSEGKSISVGDKDIVGRTCTGRDVLESLEGISRQHAQFYWSDDTWFIVDLGSKNGTSVNGNKIPPKKMTPVRPGDVIAISKTFSATVTVDRRASQPVAEKAKGESDQREKMVVMFVDLKGSTDYFQEKGTLVASSWINNFYSMLTEVVSSNNGRHIKNIGDAILAVFPDTVKAARAAVMMQVRTKEHNKGCEDPDQYHIRIGMNHGKVLCENNDVFGNTVNIASRIQGLAPAGKTYISDTLYEMIRDSGEFQTGFIGNEQLRGVKEKMAVYELLIPHTPSVKGTVTIKV